MAQKVNNSNSEHMMKIKKMENDLSLNNFTSRKKSTTENNIEEKGEDFAYIKKQKEDEDVTLAHFKYNKKDEKVED